MKAIAEALMEARASRVGVGVVGVGVGAAGIEEEKTGAWREVAAGEWQRREVRSKKREGKSR